MLAVEFDDVLRVAYRHEVWRRAHERAATVWAYGTFWITLFTAVLAGSAGLAASTNERAALWLGVAAAVVGAFSAAMQYSSKNNDIAGGHKRAADDYRDSYERFRLGLTQCLRNRGEGLHDLLSSTEAHLANVQKSAPRATPFLYARFAANREKQSLRRQLTVDIQSVDQSPAASGS